jgi:hypothetical protein
MTTNVLVSASSQIRYDNGLYTSPFDTEYNKDLYNQLAARPESAFIRESREVALGDFVKLVLLDRRSNLEASVSNGQTNRFAVTGTANAVTPVVDNPLLQGSWVCVCAIAEEGVATKGVRRHYTGSEFANQLVWSIAHELCHLLVGGVHFSYGDYLMTDSNPAPDGIVVITSGSEEIQLINLRNRQSIEH